MSDLTIRSGTQLLSKELPKIAAWHYLLQYVLLIGSTGDNSLVLSVNKQGW